MASAPDSRVLVLGGTTEARRLAETLVAGGVAVLTALAGRTPAPALPGELRIGGFGGADGLRTWLSRAQVARVVDATHPFAATISHSAADACGAVGVPLLRLSRPGFTSRSGDAWTWVDDLPAAARAVESCGATRVLLTTGRQEVAAFAAVESAWFLVRCIAAPSPPLPPACEVLLERGPYTLEGERSLMRSRAIDLLVTKDSGGEATEAKLHAAREFGVPVVIVRRPAAPAVESVESVGAAVAWVLRG